MRGVFDQSITGGGIILKEELLMPEYVPEDLLHRQAEMQEVAEAIKPLLAGKQPDNLFIHGNSGTGKTTCVKHVLKELDDHTSKVKAVYVNCWQHSTRMAVYWQIAHALQEPIPRRGWATDEIFQRVMEVLQRQNIKILLVLDELDGLFFRGEEKLLYELARSGNGKPIFGIIGISNNPRLLDGQDARVKSSLRFSSLQFKNYSEAELFDILSIRAKASLKSGACSREVIEQCSTKAFAQKSNVRIGLELLWKSANNAEKAGRTQIGLKVLSVISLAKTSANSSILSVFAASARFGVSLRPASGMPSSRSFRQTSQKYLASEWLWKLPFGHEHAATFP